MDKKLQEYADTWKEFQEYQNRIRQRNLNSDEYAKFNNETSINIWNCHYYLLMRDVILKKDLFENTFEGMLSWINKGRSK